MKSIIYLLIICLIQSCQLEPIVWTPPKKKSYSNDLKMNAILQKVKTISIGNWIGPEDIAFDNNGNLYCGVHFSSKDYKGGCILKIDSSYKIEIFAKTNSWVTGLHFDNSGQLIGCDQERGIISIDEEGNFKVICDKNDKNEPLLFPNDVDIANNNLIYFTNSSSKYKLSKKNVRRLIFELKKDGGLYEYNPITQKVKTLIDSTYFANGIALSEDNSYIIMAETSKYRIIKYWLKGSKVGSSEVLIDNLPGFPNGISRASDGNFWVGFSTERNETLDKVHSSKFKKKLIFSLPEFIQPKQAEFGLILKINQKGQILKSLFDNSGKIVPEVGSVQEYKGFLYIGGDFIKQINYLDLSKI